MEHAAAYAEWLRVRGLAESTAASWRECFRQFTAFVRARGVTTEAEVDGETVEDYRRYVRERQRIRRRGGKLGWNRIRTLLESVKQYFDWAVQRGLIMMNPAVRLTWASHGASLPRYVPTEKEMEALLSQPDTGDPEGLRDRAMMEVMYSTGIRAGETSRLDVYDVDVTGGTLTVRRGKGGKDRVVPLGRTAAEWVARYLREARPLLSSDARRTQLFLSPQGRPFTVRVVGRRIKTHARGCSLNARLSSHSLRHAVATHLLAGGASIVSVQRILGHAGLGTTMVYTHLKPTEVKEAHRRFHPRERMKVL